MQYTLKKTKEVIYPEIWQWVAEYLDGTTLRQFDDEAKEFHQFAEIDQSKLAAFHMESPSYPHRFSLVFNPKTMKLIHFYRNTFSIGAERTDYPRIYCFGYEKRLGTRTEKVVFAIDGHGDLVASDGSIQVMLDPTREEVI